MLLLFFIFNILVTNAIPVSLNQLIFNNLYNTPKIKNDNQLNAAQLQILYEISYIVDITYCISSTTKISPPFRCPKNCDKFGNMQLIHQWSTDSEFDTNLLVTGFISIDHSKRTWYISLRGTRSLGDTYIDFGILQNKYINDGIHLEPCEDCYVHSGFYSIFIHSLQNIQYILFKTIMSYPTYNLIVSGHSMGGAVAVLLSLYLKDNYKYLKLKCITYGQPKIGNGNLARFIDRSFNLESYVNIKDRNLLRVTNIGDSVTQVPFSSTEFEYDHSNGELMITKLSSDVTIEDIIVCPIKDSQECRKNELLFTSAAHLMYFHKLGTCLLYL